MRRSVLGVGTVNYQAERAARNLQRALGVLLRVPARCPDALNGILLFAGNELRNLARATPDEKARQYLWHLHNSWLIAAARRMHEPHNRSAEVISLREPFKIAIR